MDKLDAATPTKKLPPLHAIRIASLCPTFKPNSTRRLLGFSLTINRLSLEIKDRVNTVYYIKSPNRIHSLVYIAIGKDFEVFSAPFILIKRTSQTKCWIKVQQRHVRVTSPILLFVVFYFTTTLSCFDAQKMKKMMMMMKKKTKGQGVQKAAWMRDFKGAYACALERSMASTNPSVWAADGGFWD